MQKEIIYDKRVLLQVLVGSAVALLVFSSLSLVLENSEGDNGKDGSKDTVPMMSYLRLILSSILVLSVIFVHLLVENK